MTLLHALSLTTTFCCVGSTLFQQRNPSTHLEVFLKLALATEGHLGVLERVDNVVHL